MFIRNKPNRSGVVSVQIIDKSSGKYRVIKTVGSSSDASEVASLREEAKRLLPLLNRQSTLNFDQEQEKVFVDMFFQGLEQICLLGPELILGKIFDDIGFNKIDDDLFRHLVITRLVYPVSKLKTVDYLFKYRGITIDVEKIYRYLDKLSKGQKELAQQISYDHTVKTLGGKLSIVFYDVTTLYFEIDDEDDLRKTGFSKEGKHQHPQILLGLLVSVDGYPLVYDIFEGNKFEGATMMPVIEAFKKKYKLQKLVVIADAGLLSNDNISQLQHGQYEYIIGARIKNETQALKDKILALKLENGESALLVKDADTDLVVSFSESRSHKDAANRKRGIEKLEKSISKGKLTKNNINNRGYNKYLRLTGDVSIAIDYEKYKADAKWDGLKGYITNTRLGKEDIIANYQHLWKIEKAFRISKTDLRIRPIYHRLRQRIEAHICIAFCAYKVYKELERLLHEKKATISPEKAIDIAKTIFQISIITPFSKTRQTRLFIPNEEQRQLLNLFGL